MHMICSFVIPCEGAMQESIRFPRCKHHQAYLELIFGFWLKVTLCRFMCDKKRIKTGTCHFNHDISGSYLAFDFLTFMHNAAHKKNGTKSKTELINSPCMFRLKYAALPCGTVFFYSIITIKRKPTMLFAYGTSYTLIIFEQTKWYFVLSICSRAHDKISICLCVVRALYAEWNKKQRWM